MLCSEHHLAMAHHVIGWDPIHDYCCIDLDQLTQLTEIDGS